MMGLDELECICTKWNIMQPLKIITWNDLYFVVASFLVDVERMTYRITNVFFFLYKTINNSHDMLNILFSPNSYVLIFLCNFAPTVTSHESVNLFPKLLMPTLLFCS